MTNSLRDLISAGACPLAPGVFDALSARLAEQAGFQVVSISGYGVEASLLGLPDLGFVGLTDIAEVASRITDAVALPVICDVDTGFGSARSAFRTSRRLEKAGIAAIHIEDQASPKKCGAMAGRPLVPALEMAQKIKACTDARRSREFMIIARTDAREAEGVAGVIDRLSAYAAAGADMAMLAESYSLEEMGRIAAALPVPLAICNGVPGWTATHETMETYAARGVRLAIAPFLTLAPAARAMREALVAVRRDDAVTKELCDRAFLHHDEINRIVGIADWEQRDTGFGAKMAVKEPIRENLDPRMQRRKS